MTPQRTRATRGPHQTDDGRRRRGNAPFSAANGPTSILDGAGNDFATATRRRPRPPPVAATTYSNGIRATQRPVEGQGRRRTGSISTCANSPRNQISANGGRVPPSPATWRNITRTSTMSEGHQLPPPSRRDKHHTTTSTGNDTAGVVVDLEAALGPAPETAQGRHGDREEGAPRATQSISARSRREFPWWAPRQRSPLSIRGGDDRLVVQ